jgi:carbonic anhydrase/acetyltransferase-like protein (isoleucine patch superfamily)
MILGSPARVVRSLNEEQIASLRRSASHYVANFKRFLRDLKPL